MELRTPLSEITRILDVHEIALKRLGILTVEDLLYHFPTRYGDVANINAIESLQAGDSATIFGKISKLKTGKTFRSKMSKSSATIEDDTGTIEVTWFRQPYLAKMLREDSLVKVTGKISSHKDKLTLNNPKIETVTSVPLAVGNSLFGEGVETGTLYPIYPESRGVSSNWMYHTLQKILKSGVLDEIEDPIPAEILKKYNLPSLNTALIWIHVPQKEDDALAARKRFAFEEIFYIQLQKKLARRQSDEHAAFMISPDEAHTKCIQEFINDFPFKPTTSQTKAILEILKDFKSGKPMSRLLEGDVGSGKTAVAAATVFATTITKTHTSKNFENLNFGNLQTAYMVPTEILAKQHFENFISYFRKHKVQVALITGSGCYKFPSKVDPAGYTKISRAQLLKWVANGEIPILIGTHALIQKSVIFKNLAYVIIDEQHRFGTTQRQKLVRKDAVFPHLLSMTATPIPRTLALTIYGDLDLTLLDQMPVGRKPIITELVLPKDRSRVYDAIRAELTAGRQAYVICPRIDEPDPDKESALNAKSVKEEAKRLKKDIFPNCTIDILHSKMKPSEKDLAMQKFQNHGTDILVATSVVEVGVNVPNATLIIIEGAERFGLAQLHQLRGRVIRSNHQAYCYVFSESTTPKTIDRLKALQTAKSGFELSEFDLQFRGSGDLSGRKQWGISDLGMEAIKNIKMVEAARSEAEIIVTTDPKLSKYPAIKQKLSTKKEIHFE